MRSVRAAIAASTTSGAEIGEVGAVVLADADEVDADAVGEHALLDDVADDLGVADVAPSSVLVTSPKVSMPNSTGAVMGASRSIANDLCIRMNASP